MANNGNLFDRAVLISISISSLGTKRKVQSQAVECDADKDMIHVSKDIMQSPILDEIRKFDSTTRKWVSDRSLPSLFRSGVYLWPISLVVDADAYMIQRQEQRTAMINRFMQVYAQERATAQGRLGSLYNPRDYPDEAKVRASFAMSYQFIECGTPGQLRDISPEMFERERVKAEGQWKNALDEAKTMLRTQLAELVDHMHDRMLPGEDGKPKRFKASLVANFSQFLELFDCRNIASDGELKSVVDQCKAVLGGVTAEQIRDSASLRDRLASGMAGIKTALDPMIVSQGRSIDMSSSDDDDLDFGDI